MHAIKLLVEDHRKFRNLMHKIKSSESEEEKRSVFSDLKREIDAHTHIEEQIFYPAIKANEEFEDLIKEGVQEHHQTDLFIREIENLAEGSEVFDAKIGVMLEGIEHHLKEEESELFPKVEEKFSETELEDLGSEMEAEKRNVNKADTASG